MARPQDLGSPECGSLIKRYPPSGPHVRPYLPVYTRMRGEFRVLQLSSLCEACPPRLISGDCIHSTDQFCKVGPVTPMSVSDHTQFSSFFQESTQIPEKKEDGSRKINHQRRNLRVISLNVQTSVGVPGPRGIPIVCRDSSRRAGVARPAGALCVLPSCGFGMTAIGLLSA